MLNNSEPMPAILADTEIRFTAMYQHRKSTLFHWLYVVTSNIPLVMHLRRSKKANGEIASYTIACILIYCRYFFLTEPTRLRRSKETLLTYSSFFNAAACHIEAQWGCCGRVVSIFPAGLSSGSVQGRHVKVLSLANALLHLQPLPVRR
ncbi:hypothetical protein [Mesorhizobium sp.]|uniref:hypothetical protein n=1 Tax=Mesorhizobium sp. TaxID=1871066 RepID=UPI0025D45D5F|nr:hypothetical protein [Mesorhizobium sp.]